jgi:hypothetical protein
MPTPDCIDCAREKRSTNRPAPFPGPRCATHNHVAVRKQRNRQADSRRASTFGITGSTYRELLAVQNGVCAVCGRPPRKGGRRLAVDHDHTCCPGPTSCGKCVRGLLCWSCNKFLHHIGDDVDRIESAADYLRNWPSWKLRETEPKSDPDMDAALIRVNELAAELARITDTPVITQEGS